MGHLNAVRSKLAGQDGMVKVGSQCNIQATIMLNRACKGVQSLTSEYERESMRGLCVRTLFQSTKDNVEYIF